jgi:hypothetical protein
MVGPIYRTYGQSVGTKSGEPTPVPCAYYLLRTSLVGLAYVRAQEVNSFCDNLGEAD